jgi:hypothetical protein
MAALRGFCAFVVALDPVLLCAEGILGSQKIRSCGALLSSLVPWTKLVCHLSTTLGPVTGGLRTHRKGPQVVTRHHMCALLLVDDLRYHGEYNTESTS